MTSPAPESLGFAQSTLENFTRDLAARRSVPGGGAAAGSALAHAAALGSMVIAFSRGKKTFEAHESLLADTEERFQSTRIEALRLADADALGFQALAALWPLAEDDPTRIEQWPTAVTAAIEPPRDLVNLAHETTSLLLPLVGRSSRMLRSDLAIAARFASLAADAAAWNVRMNLDAFRALPGRAEDANQMESTISRLLEESRQITDRIDRACLEDQRTPISEA